jgi:hypothetical protein
MRDGGPHRVWSVGSHALGCVVMATNQCGSGFGVAATLDIIGCVYTQMNLCIGVWCEHGLAQLAVIL